MDVDNAIKSLIHLFVLIIGSVFNIYCFVSILRSKVRRSKIWMYVIILNVTDTIAMYGYSIIIICHLNEFNILNDIKALCRLVFLLTAFCGFVSIWVSATIGIERTLCIFFPIIHRVNCTSSITKTVLLIIIILSLPYSVVATIYVREDNVCFYKYKHLFYIDVTLQAILPAVIMGFCNIAIIYKLFHRPTSIGTNPSSKHAVKSLKLILVNNFIFIVTNVMALLISILSNEYDLLQSDHFVYYIIGTILNHFTNVFFYHKMAFQFRAMFKFEKRLKHLRTPSADALALSAY
uniref:G-protein coupled receptors family 1 profile domain-containing protein n=1 Tax=Octopus bimaculoides TaxID=37653 RepID=A0A0L8IB86_OCTBM